MHYSFGLGVSSLDHRRREEFPAIFTIMRVLEELMKELSVFIDESGDFGEITERPAYYLVTLLFHDQKNEIASNVKKLEDSTKNSGFDFDGFDKIIVYYDNGQIELGAILNTVFSIHFFNVEFRKAEPQKYRLLQAADFICSMELLKIKKNENRLSKSEKQFFYKSQELKKTFFKTVDKKRLRK